MSDREDGRRARAPAPLSLDGISTYPLSERKSKVGVGDFARPHARGASLASFLDALPRVLAVQSLRALAGDIHRARERGRPILWGLGAHVLKVGLSPVLLDLMQRGFGVPPVPRLARSRLVNFIFWPPNPFDIWIDDFRFEP